MKSSLLPLIIFSTGALASPLIKQTVATGLRDPMEVAISPTGEFYVVERAGRVLRINPSTGGIFEIGQINVYCITEKDPKTSYGREDGLLGMALDPAFQQNRRIYLYYSAAEKLETRLSRFTLKNGKIDPASELQLITIPTEREKRVCHQAGCVEFGPDGMLYLSTGDNTNPFESKGVAPIDNRDDRVGWDAQRSAGNTNDLRGKILRIKPTENGYEIPEGNLFPKGTANTRPEIYVMGCRNPFRLSIDSKTKTLYWGEVGPDADNDSANGPRGYDEVNQAKAAGNFGWPFVIANNKPYPIIDFATNTIGETTDPEKPKNHGQRNTGLRDLPQAQPAFIWYPYKAGKEFPTMGEGGRNAMAGPVFYHDPNRSYNILAKEDNQTLIHYDWMRGKLFKSKLTADERFEKMDVMMDKLVHPIDLEMDRDGSLVLLEYGSDWYFNKNGSVSRLLPDEGNKPPTIAIKPSPADPKTFIVHQSTDPDHHAISLTWYLSDGETERILGTSSAVTIPDGTFTEIRAVATDEKGAFSIARIPLSSDGELPNLKLELPETKGKIVVNQTLRFKVTAEQLPDASSVTVRSRYIPPTGHDAGGPELNEEHSKLLTANQCIACHQVDSGIVGPSLIDIALRYKGQNDAKNKLIEKVKTGGSGSWGATPMPPQVALKPADAEKLISGILQLSIGMTETRGALQGTLELAVPKDPEPGGAWEISAEAPGYSPAKIRIPAK